MVLYELYIIRSCFYRSKSDPYRALRELMERAISILFECIWSAKQ